MTKQDLVEAICSQTGISKRDLAKWIGTDHSVLCRYIAGTRPLPLRAMQQLLFLHQQLSDLPPLAATPKPTEIVEANWADKADECRRRLKVLQVKYKAMCGNSVAAARALQLLAALAADTVMLTPKKERWIEEQHYQAEKLASENGAAARQNLLLQITLASKELEVYAAFEKGEAMVGG